MMIKVAIAIGVGIFVLVAICCVSWGVWKLRHRMSKAQISATPDEIPVQDRKDVFTLPTIKTSDLNGGAKLRCPLCWLDFRDEDIMRQLPQCDHIFHRHCIDPLLDKKVTCPVCSSVLTLEKLNGTRKRNPALPQQLIASNQHSRTPSWVLVNRPVPLPKTALVTSSSSSETFEIELNAADSLGSRDSESPLLKHLTESHAEEWNDPDLETCIDISFTFGTEIPVEKRQQSSHSLRNGKEVDSFSFGISSDDAFTFGGVRGGEVEASSDAVAAKSSMRRSRSKDNSSNSNSNSSSSSSSDFNPSLRHSRSTSRSSRSTNTNSDSFRKLGNWDFGHPHLPEVSEHIDTEHLPLTKPPEDCTFDVLPVINGSGRPEQAAKEPILKGVSKNRNTYSHL